MTLEVEIKKSARQLSTDAYDMSVGELINIYRDGDLVVTPPFQRLFRWNGYQKSHLIESMLIGVPLPSIFVFELSDGRWELIDGLQRVSTILEFVGILRDAEDKLYAPSVLEGTRYLPSLEGKSWDGKKGHPSIGAAQQIAIKRSRISIQILKKTSDEKAKYDLFQRLNSHGSTATHQELRNCILYMINKDMFSQMRDAAASDEFIAIMHPSEKASENQGLMDFVTRYLVFMYVEYDSNWDIEEYLNNGIIELAELVEADANALMRAFIRTVKVLTNTGEENILRRYKDGVFQGRVGQAAFETVFLGIAQNIDYIEKKKNPSKYVIDRTKELWGREDVKTFTRAGFRGTDRIKQTVSFGREWFSK